MPSISKSGFTQPETKFSIQRDPAIWAMVAACRAATAGCTKAVCTVDMMRMRSVMAASAAATPKLSREWLQKRLLPKPAPPRWA